MSTRASIHFKDKYTDICIYQHGDGYPDGEHGVIAELDRFFGWNEEQFKGMGGFRYSDPEYLAARFIVFLATVEALQPWNGLSIAICDGDHGDVAFIYTVTCKTSQRPDVSFTT